MRHRRRTLAPDGDGTDSAWEERPPALCPQLYDPSFMPPALCKVGKQCWCGGAQQGLARLPLRHRVERGEELYVAAGERRHGYAVPIQQTVAGQGGQSRTGRQNAGKVEWVSTRQGYPFTRRWF